MDNSGRLFSQVAAEAGVSATRAKLAVYLDALSRQGKTLAYAASVLRRKPATVKELARDFMIDFPDYRPFAKARDNGEQIEPRVRLNFLDLPTFYPRQS